MHLPPFLIALLLSLGIGTVTIHDSPDPYGSEPIECGVVVDDGSPF